MNALDPTDAVSNHLADVDRMLRRDGHETAIFSEHVHPDFASIRRPISDLCSAEGDLLLFHFAGYTTLLGSVAQFQGRRGVIYHNVTPAHFFEEKSETKHFCEKGREQLSSLSNVFHFGLGVSEYNRAELVEAGFKETRVLPISSDVSPVMSVEPSSALLARYNDDTPNILMVGRVAPHKGIIDGIRAFAYFRNRCRSDARLFIAGRTRGYSDYLDRIHEESRRLGLGKSVVITGEVSHAELRALYQLSSSVLVMSEHEGFCIPVVESMKLGIPVVAFRAGAVSETMGGAGVLLESRDEETAGTALKKVFLDRGYRSQLLRDQYQRVKHYSRESVESVLRETIQWATELPAPDIDVSTPPSFSIVVCTYNRANVLGECLEALRSIEYPEYEIVVVNGPSTDDTDKVLSRFSDVKRVENPERNLSVSRNLGIAAAAGDIVAFIDDDAVPDRDWLRQLAGPYTDVTVGGVGGKVFGPGGDHLQFHNGIISRYGMPRAHQAEPGTYDIPGGEWYNILMGTNSSFRMKALKDVGGFDENYEYYHDESDLCVRIIQAGYRIAHVENADVWHEFEKSHIRPTRYDVNWRVVAKNTVYFFFKNNRWCRRPLDIFLPLRAVIVLLGSFTRWFIKGEIGRGLFFRSLCRWGLGVGLGYGKGLFRKPRRNLSLRKDPRGEKLKPVGQVIHRWTKRPLHVALVSQQYPPDHCGGIGVYTEQLARGLVESGHRVSVIARGNAESAIWKNGVKIHRKPDESFRSRPLPFMYRVVRKNLARSFSVSTLLDSIHRTNRIDIVETPLWDGEAFVPSIESILPLVIRLNTPMAMAIETQEWKRTNDMDLACEMEWEMLRRSDGWIDTSGSIVNTLVGRFGLDRGKTPVRTIPFGIAPADLRRSSEQTNGEVRILFVGRLEPRKGIDTLLAAIPRVLTDNDNVQFTLAGEIPGGSGLPDQFFRRREMRDMCNRVHFLNRVDDNTLQKLYGECAIFVAPSRYESFGIVFLEAMSHGKPVVACCTGGTECVVRNGETGILVPPDDAVALGDALVHLSVDRGIRERMGSNGRKEVIENYSEDSMVKSTLEFYEEIIREKKQ